MVFSIFRTLLLRTLLLITFLLLLSSPLLKAALLWKASLLLWNASLLLWEASLLLWEASLLLWEASLLLLASVMSRLSCDPSVSPMFLLLMGKMVFLLLLTVHCCAGSLQGGAGVGEIAENIRVVAATVSVLAITCDLAVEGALMLLLTFQMSMFLLLLASL